MERLTMGFVLGAAVDVIMEEFVNVFRVGLVHVVQE
jgi:hypothetical protein